MNVKIKSIRKVNSRIKFDLEIKDNHNFFANGILVHNCRCIVKKDGMWSRNGKRFVSVPHIYEQLKPYFDKNPDLIFDGELYCDKFQADFNKIISLVKKSKPTDEDIAESAKHIQYWVYDFPSCEDVFSVRNKELLSLFGSKVPKSIILVPTNLVKDEKNLDTLYNNYLEDGKEGQIIRLDAKYENKRSNSILKRKEFITEEFEIVDICEGEGNRSGTAGYVICKLKNGETFKSNIKGNREYVGMLLIFKKKLIGKMASIKYFRLTPDGVPRFPFMITVRDYE